MKITSVKQHIEEGDLVDVVASKVRKKIEQIKTKAYIHREGVKKVALIGWIGAFNLGDEMMLDVTLRHFKVCGIETTLITHKVDNEVKARYQGNKLVARRPLTDEAISQILTDNDALFINGGALIDDRDYEANDSLARDISRIAKVFIENSKKVIVYGISTNSNISNPDAINDYKYLIENATYFSVRDTFSKEELSKIADSNKIHLVDDIVFADSIFSKKREVHNNTRKIVIVPIFDKDTTHGIEALLRKVIATTEDDIRIVSFYDEGNHELRSIEKILQELGDERYRVKEIIIPRNATELYSSFGDTRLVISMRYHGTLFAGNMGKRVLRLDHNKHPHYLFKNKYLASKYGYGVDYVNITDLPDMTAEDLRSIMDSVEVRKKVASRVVYSRASKNLHNVIKLL